MIRKFVIVFLLVALASLPSFATYSADWTLSQTSAFQQQVQMSVFKAALAIANEAATTHPALDAKRHALAVTVLGASPLGYGAVNGALNMQFVWATIETGLSGTPTDAQVDTAVSSVWNGIAGVSARDQADLQ